MTTAPAAPQEQILYGPDGQALTSSTTSRAAIERPAVPAGDWHAVRTTNNATVWEKKPQPTAPEPATDDDHQRQLAARDARITALEARVATLSKPTNPSPATPPAAKKDRKGFNHWGPWIALWAAVGLTASGEYALARFVGFHDLVSALLPIGIDIYVIQAFRRHRDVAAALVLMVLTNALVHLAEAGLFGVETVPAPDGETAFEPTWWLIVLVSAIAPFIVWRVHRITETVPATSVAHTAGPAETVRETAAAPVAETAPETTADPVAATLTATHGTVSLSPTTRVADADETAPATPRTQTATAHVAAAETKPHQRETAPATRRATPGRTTTSRTRKPAETGVAAPAKLRSKEQQLAIVAPFVDDWNGPEKDLPLQPIADALGASKATASRRVAEYRAQKTA
jgi:hypothetical protein